MPAEGEAPAKGLKPGLGKSRSLPHQPPLRAFRHGECSFPLEYPNAEGYSGFFLPYSATCVYIHAMKALAPYFSHIFVAYKHADNTTEVFLI